MSSATKNPARVTRKSAIEAHCWQCLGYWDDPNRDCENPRCPLYEFQPYRKGEPDHWWTQFHHGRKGKQVRTKRKMTPAQREAFEKMRGKQ